MRDMHSGFTLIEAVVVLAVLGICTAIGIPALSSLLERSRSAAAISSLTAHMTLARMSAVTYRQPAVLCPSASGNACQPGIDWSGGWMLFLDGNGNQRPDAEGDILRRDLAPASAHLRVVGTPGRPRLRYLPDGRSAGTNLTVSICSRDGRLLGSVIVNNAGRPRSERPKRPQPCPR